MAFSVLAHNITTYNNAEFNRYLEEYHSKNGWVIINIKNPENLPENFIQRFK